MSHICEHCQKDWRSKSRLLRHQKTKCGKKKVIRMCPTCQLTFPTNWKLNRHLHKKGVCFPPNLSDEYVEACKNQSMSFDDVFEQKPTNLYLDSILFELRTNRKISRKEGFEMILRPIFKLHKGLMMNVNWQNWHESRFNKIGVRESKYKYKEIHLEDALYKMLDYSKYIINDAKGGWGRLIDIEVELNTDEIVLETIARVVEKHYD